MNEYLIKEETLDNIAIQSMNLMGKTEAVSTSTIISDLTNVNSEVVAQADLINQIASALEGKASGSGEDVSYNTCTVNISGIYIGAGGCCYTAVENGALCGKIVPVYSNNLEINNVLCGSLIVFPGSYLNLEATSGVVINNGLHVVIALQAPMDANAIVSVTLTQD